MRARKKGTDTWIDIASVQLANSCILYHADALEFDIPNTSSNDDKHWQEVREKTAIELLGGYLIFMQRNPEDLSRIVDITVKAADALVAELKNK